MTTAQLCPLCQRANAERASRCAACGAVLGAGDTEPGSLHRLDGGAPAGPRRRQSGAVWLEDLAAPAAAVPPATAMRLTLRDVQAPPAPPPPVPDDDWQAGGGMVRDPQAPVTVPNTNPVHGAVRTLAQTDPAALAAAKAAKKAAVRRARLGAASPAPATAPAVADVLVLDPEDGSRAVLATLLGAFGFRVHAAVSVAKASALSASRPFVAAFVDIALEGPDGAAGADLCRQLKQHQALPGGAPTALVLVSTQLSPVEKVRASFAGCDGFLVKPVTRGDVARALEACGVRLPADARRG